MFDEKFPKEEQKPETEIEKNLGIVARETGITLAGKISSAGLRYITQIVLAHLLGTTLFGIYALGIVIYQIGETFSKIGLQAGATRYVSIYHSTGDTEKLKGVLTQAVVIPFFAGTIFLMFFFATSNLIAQKIFGEPTVGSAIRLFAIAIPFGASMTVASVATVGFQTTKYLVYVKNLYHPLTNLLLIALLGSIGFGLHGTIIAWILASISGLILAVHFIRKVFPKKAWSRVKSAFETGSLLKFSIPVAFGGLLWFFLLGMDTIMLGFFRSTSDVGVYRAASQTSLLLMIFLESLNTIFSPMIAELFHKNKLQKMEGIFKVSTRWSFSLTLPIFLIMVFSGKEILHIFGSEFVLGWLPLLILSVGHLVNASAGTSGYMLIMTGHHYQKLFSDISLVVINIILNILLIPRWGLIGAATATAISFAGVNIMRGVQVYLTLKIHAYNWSYLKPLGAGIISGLVGLIVDYVLPPTHFLISLILTSGAVFLSYAISLWALHLDENDRMIIKKIQNKLKLK